MKISLSIKYAFSVSLIIVVTSMILSATFISRHISMLKQNLIDKGQSLVKSFADNSEFGMVFYNPQQLNSIASSLLKQQDVVYAIITDMDGDILTYQGDEEWRTHITVAQPPLISEQRNVYEFLTDEKTGEEVFHCMSPIYSQTFRNEEPELTLLSEDLDRKTVKRRIGTSHLGISLNNMHDAIAIARQKLILMTFCIVLVGIATSILLSMYVTKPITKLVSATHQIAGGNLDVSLRAETKDEIGELATSFNTMTRTLKRTTVSRNYIDNILRSMNDILIVVTMDGIIERVNATACGRLGFAEEELLGREFASILTGQDKRGSSFEKLVKDCPLSNVERTYLTHENCKVPMLFSCSLMRGNEAGADRLVTVAQDITKLKLIEKDLRKAKESAEKANSAKSEFLANMSHELRTPLHCVLSFAELGVERSNSADLVKVHDYFKEIDSSGRILLYLMNSLLDLAKLESGKMRFNFEETNLNELISSAVSEFSLICSERGLSIQVVESSENVECVIDPEKIKQVMRNILANAVRFSPDGGEIEVYLTRNNELVTVSVGDQGMGIPPEELDGIFEKFVQSSKTNTGAGGTGLGLSISREIILKHKGRIWAENRSPNGALFIFELLQNLKIFTATETQILRRKDGPVPKRI